MAGRERTMLLRWRKQVGNPIPSRRSKVREIDRRYAQDAERPGIGCVERRVSLEEAAQATRIRRDYLAKLESDDHSMMPEPIYVRGFIKTYANYLGLDGDRLAAQIRFWQERRRRARRRPLWDL